MFRLPALNGEVIVSIFTDCKPETDIIYEGRNLVQDSNQNNEAAVVH